MDFAMKMSLRLPKTNICFVDLTEDASAHGFQHLEVTRPSALCRVDSDLDNRCCQALRAK